MSCHHRLSHRSPLKIAQLQAREESLHTAHATSDPGSLWPRKEAIMFTLAATVGQGGSEDSMMWTNALQMREPHRWPRCLGRRGCRQTT